MSAPAMSAMLSKRAKKQWESEEYKEFMVGKFLAFYENNAEYRQKNNELLNDNQKEYWSNTENVKKQSGKVVEFFIKHPELKRELSSLSTKRPLASMALTRPVFCMALPRSSGRRGRVSTRSS